jgi:RNA polymerase sigma factor (sigma-70 family)
VAGYLIRRTRDPDLTADLTAETFAAAILGADRFRDEGRSAVSWLLGIARNLLGRTWQPGQVEQRARRRRRVEAIAASDASLERVEALVDDADPSNPLLVALDALPNDQREAIRAHVLEEQLYADLAERLGVPRPRCASASAAAWRACERPWRDASHDAHARGPRRSRPRGRDAPGSATLVASLAPGRPAGGRRAHRHRQRGRGHTGVESDPRRRSPRTSRGGARCDPAGAARGAQRAAPSPGRRRSWPRRGGDPAAAPAGRDQRRPHRRGPRPAPPARRRDDPRPSRPGRAPRQRPPLVDSPPRAVRAQRGDELRDEPHVPRVRRGAGVRRPAPAAHDRGRRDPQHGPRLLPRRPGAGRRGACRHPLFAATAR